MADPAPLSPAELAADLAALAQPSSWFHEPTLERIARVINSAPALLATIKGQAARIAELEAGLREAVDKGAMGRLYGSDVARLRALLPTAPKEG